MKKNQYLVILTLTVLVFTRCSKSSDPSSTSSVSLKMTASTSNGKTSISGKIQAADSVKLTDVKVNIRDIKFEFDHEDEHFKKDSTYHEDQDSKLKGPFIVDLINAGSFVDQVVTTVKVPNARYERIQFRLSPSTETGDMIGKSIYITGKIDTIPFVFWHNANIRFGAKFSDSTSLATSGTAVSMAIHLELEKILSKLNGGVDLTKAVDGNKDGVITIDPQNDDGNREIAEMILYLLARHTHCDKDKH